MYAVNVLRFSIRRNSCESSTWHELHAKLHTFDDYSRMKPYPHNEFVIKAIDKEYQKLISEFRNKFERYHEKNIWIKRREPSAYYMAHGGRV